MLSKNKAISLGKVWTGTLALQILVLAACAPSASAATITPMVTFPGICPTFFHNYQTIHGDLGGSENMCIAVFGIHQNPVQSSTLHYCVRDVADLSHRCSLFVDFQGFGWKEEGVGIVDDSIAETFFTLTDVEVGQVVILAVMDGDGLAGEPLVVPVTWDLLWPDQ